MTTVSGPYYNQIGYWVTTSSTPVTSISAQITFNKVGAATNGIANYYNMINARLSDGTSVYIGLHEPGSVINSDPAPTGTADFAIFNASAQFSALNGSTSVSYVDSGLPSLRALNTNVNIVAGATYTLKMVFEYGNLDAYVIDSAGNSMEIASLAGLSATSFQTAIGTSINPGHEFTGSNVDPTQQPSDDVIISNIQYNGGAVPVASVPSGSTYRSAQDNAVSGQNPVTSSGTVLGNQATREMGANYMETASGASGYNTVHLAGTNMNIIGGNAQSALQLNATYHDLTSDTISGVPILDMNGQSATMTLAEYRQITTFLNGNAVTLTTGGVVNVNSGVSVYNLTNGNSTVNINNTNETNVHINGGTGTTTVVFDGYSTEYTVTSNADHSLTLVDHQAGRDGAVTLSSIQNLTFAGSNTVSFATASGLSTIPPANNVGTFVTQENANGRGANGIAVDYDATNGAAVGTNLGAITPQAGHNAVIGFQSAVFNGGYDVVLLDGPRSNYAIQVNNSGVTMIRDIGINDVTYGQIVTIVGESNIVFNGAHISLNDPHPASSTTNNSYSVLNYPNDIYFIVNQANAQLAQFYNATLPWEPQPSLAGFEYWEGQLAQGMSLNAIAQSFINTSYFQQNFGDPGTTHVQHVAYVESLYHNILGMNVDGSNSGVQYWVNDMDTGVLDGAGTLISFTNATSTTSLINASSGASAGTGNGWLINYNVTGGYADPGVQQSPSVVLNQGSRIGYVDSSQIDTSGLNNSVMTVNEFTVSPNSLSTTKGGEIIVASANIKALSSSGSGDTLISSANGGSTLNLGGTSDVAELHGSSNVVHISALGATVVGYQLDGTDSLTLGQTGGGANPNIVTTVTSAAKFDGHSLATSAATGTFIYVGSLADNSASTMATAANAVYSVADGPNEHVVFYGQVGNDTMMYNWEGNSAIVSADANNNHLVDANELSASVELIGINSISITTSMIHTH